jgi:hypothetical protein
VVFEMGKQNVNSLPRNLAREENVGGRMAKSNK